jgi:hypothetical protein
MQDVGYLDTQFGTWLGGSDVALFNLTGFWFWAFGVSVSLLIQGFQTDWIYSGTERYDFLLF